MQKSHMQISINGTKTWRLNGKLHRENGPAMIHTDGTGSWWLNGKCIWEEEHARFAKNKFVILDNQLKHASKV